MKPHCNEVLIVLMAKGTHADSVAIYLQKRLFRPAADSLRQNRELEQTDAAAAERRRSTSKSPFRRTQGQVISLGP